MTAATERYLIESISARVDLCESQGGSWVTIQRDITLAEAERFGFNPNSPAVRRVFADAHHFSGVVQPPA